ncbi:MAG: hypothetical protein F4X02_01640 [Chloroflexi bacterium]|nr:hypothetical protein [Chloroflexota bacterium]
MNIRTFVLYKPGGRVVRGYSYGNLTGVRYLDVVPTGIESPNRDEFIQLVEQARLTEDELGECRIGYVDDKGVGDYTSWQEFLDLAKESG